ncbi:MAG TPA: hypothetical protein VHK65_08075 [Candidatus Dormibacteraeota bacterium]|nr:hypothetical protein [Candidatus Dormibacteraeota bacterium]
MNEPFESVVVMGPPGLRVSVAPGMPPFVLQSITRPVNVPLLVGIGVAVAVGIAVGVAVGLAVALAVGLGVAITLAVAVGVAVELGVEDALGVALDDGDAVGMGELTAVDGDGEKAGRPVDVPPEGAAAVTCPFGVASPYQTHETPDRPLRASR